MIYLWWNVWMELNRRIFQDTLMQPKTSSFSLQGRNRAAPVGDEESWGIQQHQQFFSYSCVISGVCLALGEALFVFSRWAGGTG